MAYTVFTPEGSPRISRIGLVAFERTLRAAREAAQAGDTIQGWTNAGHPNGRWSVREDGRLSKLPDRERRAVRIVRKRERSWSSVDGPNEVQA